MAAYLKKPFSHNLLIARKPLPYPGSSNHLLFAAGKGGKRLNLMANNMSNFVLEGFNFSKASLLFCNLSYSNLQHARFRDADLTNSLLFGPTLPTRTSPELFWMA